MLVMTLGLICFIPLPAGGTLFSAILIVSTILVIGIFHIFDMNLKRMYTCIISVAIVESIIYVLYITFIAG